MVHATVVSAPTIGGTVASLDDSAARSMPGVLRVVPLGGAVAVVAEHYWQVRLALERLNVTWQLAAGTVVDDREIETRYARRWRGRLAGRRRRSMGMRRSPSRRQTA
jgi:CO/xanthine dehydrogenase Mo-binding subunit